MTTYFLSYARLDQTIALRFADDLIAAGVSVWVDQYDIRPSQHWDRAVESAVRSCEGMIVILSPNSANSPNVADEVSVAIESGKTVIPVLIETCTLPLRMTRMQFIDATRDYDSALQRCLAYVTAGEPPKPRALGEARAPAEPAVVIDPKVLADAERRLAGFMGPIAKRLVTDAASRAKGKADLYARLAESIPSEADRRSFLGWLTDEPRTPRGAPPPGAPTASEASEAEAISAEELQRIAKALTRHLGPIAPRLVDRERASATSKLDLCLRLGQRISHEGDRAAFLKEVQAS